MLVIGLGANLSCGASPADPTITSITPNKAYNNGGVELAIGTTGVRPAFDIDLGAATSSSPVKSVFVLLPPGADPTLPAVPLVMKSFDRDVFTGRTDVELPPGTYQVKVTNPDGRSATSREAASFVSLGPDLTAPTLTLIDPIDGTRLPAGRPFTATIEVADGLGTIANARFAIQDPTLGSMNPPALITDTLAGSPRLCSATFTAPTPPNNDTLVMFPFSVDVTDGGGNQAHLDANFSAALAPTVLDFSPAIGRLDGTQSFVIHGAHFLPDARVRFGADEATNAVVMTDPFGSDVISGRVPPHGRAETVILAVETAGGQAIATSAFQFVAAPQIRGIEPAVGPAQGRIRVTVKGTDFREATKIFVGTGPDDKREMLDRVTVLPPNKVTGCLVAGAGTGSVWAEDPDTGSANELGPAALQFTYVPDPPDMPTALSPDCLSSP